MPFLTCQSRTKKAARDSPGGGFSSESPRLLDSIRCEARRTSQWEALLFRGCSSAHTGDARPTPME